MDRTPASLLEQVRNPSDQDAWRRFVQLYTPLLYHWVRRLGLPLQDARDLVQDVFMVLVEKLPHFAYNPERSFRAWLRTILLNKWRDHQRRRGVVLLASGEGALSPPAGAGSLHELEEAEYRQQLVTRALEVMQAEFQPNTWRACWESVVAGRPAEEVARDLGITRNAVYVAKSRVLRRLRRELEGLLE